MRRRNEVLVGILITIALIIGITGTIWLVRGGLRSGYPLYGIFPWGTNLRVGQPVRLAGVQVGYVGDVQLRDNGTLVVTMKLENGRRVPQGTTAVVTAVGIFGDAEVALTPKGPSSVAIAEGDTVPTGASAAGLPELTAKADSVAGVAVKVSRTLEQEMVANGGIADLRAAIASSNALVLQLNRVVAEQSRQLTMTQSQLRHTMASVDSATVDSTVRNFRATSANMAAITDSLRITTGRLNATIAKLENGEGTAGKLLTDTLLYSDIRRLVTRVDSVTADFKKNPRRYINLEIF